MTQLHCTQEDAEETVAGKLCDAANLAADTAVSQLQPLHQLHVQGVAGGEGSEGPLDGAAGLAAIMQALQLAFSDLMGPLREPLHFS